MKRLIILPLLLLTLSLGATKVYVATTGNDGTGDGTSGNPYLTIATGISHASAGDTVFIVAGTYNVSMQIVLPVQVSLMGEGETSNVILTYTSVSSSNGCIQLASNPTEGTDGNQSISNLKLDGDLTGTTGIVVYCRDNVVIHDITMVDFDQCGIHFRGGALAGKATIKATGNQVYNCNISNSSTRGAVSNGLLRISNQSGMLIHDNILRQTDKALGSNGNIIDGVGGYNDGLKYYNNKSYKNDNEGTEWNFHIETWDTEGGIEISNNEFHGGGTCIDIGGVSNLKGTYDYSWWVHGNYFGQPILSAQTYRYNIGIDIERNGEDIIIEKNHFENYNWGVYFSCAIGLGAKNVRISYNLFENIGTTNNIYAAAVMIASEETSLGHSNILIDNNTMTAGAAFNVGAGVITAIYAGTLENLRIRNCIINGFYRGPIWVAADINPGTVYYQNNQLNNTSNTIYYSAGRAITTLITADNQIGNPLFKSNETFRLRPTSPAIDAGIDVGLTTDYWGHRIPQGSAPDIGATEYGNYVLFYNGKQLTSK